MQTADSNRTQCSYTGWLSAESADSLFNNLGYNVERLRNDACKKGFKGFDLKSKISLSVRNKIRFNASTNVAGILKGTIRACFNNDMMLPIGRMKDIMITGYGQSDLDEMIADAASEQDRYVIKDPNSQTGMYFRSDHFSFAKKGVPSAFARGNVESREHGREWASKMEQDYLNNRYHRPADNYEPDKWDMTGIAEDAKICFSVGYRLVNSDFFPSWKPGSEFRNVRK